MVHTLEQEQLDAAFLSRYCLLDQEDAFWQGFERTENTPEYLRKYLILYFDVLGEVRFLFQRGPRTHRFHGGFRPAPTNRSMSLDKALHTLGLTREELAKMDKKALTAFYRKKAHITHPDKGGDHDAFIALTAAYKELVRTRL